MINLTRTDRPEETAYRFGIGELLVAPGLADGGTKPAIYIAHAPTDPAFDIADLEGDALKEFVEANGITLIIENAGGAIKILELIERAVRLMAEATGVPKELFEREPLAHHSV